MSRTLKSSGWPGWMRCRSRSTSVICCDRRPGSRSADGGRDDDLVDVGEPHRLRRVGRLRRRRHRVERSAARRVELAERVDLLVGSVAAGGALVRRRSATSPATRYLIVVHGASTMSSWSMPIMFAPLRVSTPIDLERDVLDADLLADRRLAAEQLADDRLADQADLAAVADVAVGERARPRPGRPSRGRRGTRASCRRCTRHPVAVAVDDLGARADDRGDAAHGRAVAAGWPRRPRGVSVDDAARAEADAAAGRRAGQDHQVVGAHAGDRSAGSRADEPWPISIMAMTAATPMTMPSVVRAERMTLRRSAWRGHAAVRRASS